MSKEPIIKINVRRATELRDKLETISDEQFNMGLWMTTTEIENKGQTSTYRKVEELTEHECGTVGCLAGWAVALYPNEKLMKSKIDDIGFIGEGAKILGMTEHDAHALFIAGRADGGQHSFPRIKRRHAIKHMTNIIEGKSGATWPVNLASLDV